MLLRSQRALACGLLLTSALACSERAAQGPSHSRPELPPASAEEPLVGLPEPMARSDAFARGVVLGPLLAPENEKAEALFKRQQLARLDEAVALGATDLQLVVGWRQQHESSLEVFPFDTVHDDLLTWLVEQAKRRKLRMWLTPVLAIESGEQTRPAKKLAPKDWDAWWWSYRRLALHYARVAATRKIGMLSLGFDLPSTEGQSDRWRKLIREVRKIYKGKLTYVASAETVDKVGFWDALDVVGVALEQTSARSEAQLLERLAPLVKRLGRNEQAHTLGYVITESRCEAGATEAARELLCQRALYQSFRDDSRLRGVYVRRVLEEARPARTGTSSAEVVRHWFQKSRG